MSDIVIRVESLAKQYRLGDIGTGSISHDINRWWYKVRGKEDPYLKIGEENDRTRKADSEYVWALQEMSFEVKKGEVLGLIGRNGAGKSTLLKILSKVTQPTRGNVKIKGRIASLLEVGTGFHPELSGRENVFLNGAILGMTRAEVKAKFDEIVDFAGIERYIDTPVKRYSSGMYVRLAFAVAAHLEPDILIVDEVLAVGDVEFQRKCLGKMKDVSDKQGRTVLFVSHNLGAIRTLCTKGLLLKNGKLDFAGTINEVVDNYLKKEYAEATGFYRNLQPRPDSDILEIRVLNKNNEPAENFAFDEEIKLSFLLRIAEKHMDAVLGFRVKDQLERNVFTSQIAIDKLANQPGEFVFSCVIPSSILVPNKYELMVGFHKVNVELIQYLESPVRFTIEETGTDFFQYSGNDYGCVFVDCKWE
jgi:lipopolysaccharide transport system ATP-binding protein